MASNSRSPQRPPPEGSVAVVRQPAPGDGRWRYVSDRAVMPQHWIDGVIPCSKTEWEWSGWTDAVVETKFTALNFWIALQAADPIRVPASICILTNAAWISKGGRPPGGFGSIDVPTEAELGLRAAAVVLQEGKLEISRRDER